MRTVALIVAGGKGQRLGAGVPKQFRRLLDRPLLVWTIMRFEKSECIDDIVIVAPDEYLLYTSEQVVNPYNFSKVTKIITGGESRRESVFRGLKSLPISTGYVAIHDGARPLVAPEDISHVVDVAHKERAAILARPISDTVKRIEGDFIISTLDRTKLYAAETPQVFQYDLIMSAHGSAPGDNSITDDSSLVEAMGFKVKIVSPLLPNLKITTDTDLIIAKSLLERDYAA
jgi:2-C-methyl-D-erythritol 4-phosphate cytidylyltransferase